MVNIFCELLPFLGRKTELCLAHESINDVLGHLNLLLIVSGRNAGAETSLLSDFSSSEALIIGVFLVRVACHLLFDRLYLLDRELLVLINVHVASAVHWDS